MNIKRRLEKMECQVPDEREPQFLDWIGNEWTEEEKTEALREHPGCTLFWKPLSTTLPTEEIRRRKEAGEPLANPSVRYIAGPANRRE